MPSLFEKVLIVSHDFAADIRLYMRELLVWLCVMFQPVFELCICLLTDH